MSLDEANKIVLKAFAFYRAFFFLEDKLKRFFGQFRGKAYPFDHPLKGLLEFLIDNDLIKAMLHPHLISVPCTAFIFTIAYNYIV